MINLYNPFKFSKIIAYMLQNVEYNPANYVKWILRTKNFGRVMYRRQLDNTKAAVLFRSCSLILILLLNILAIYMAYAGIINSDVFNIVVSVILLIITPILTAFLIIVPLVIAKILISIPKENKLIKESKIIFTNTKAVKIAVAGSYGKTSMKEMLGTVLSQGKVVAITPANKNVASSHAIFARKLKGDEEVLVVEFGEGKPGDVKHFNDTFKQDIVIITGIAPAHLDAYSSLQEAASDIFSATNNVSGDSVYVNTESMSAKEYIKSSNLGYSRDGLTNTKVSNVVSDVSGLSFVINSTKNTYNINTKLVGLHMIGPICAVVDIAQKIGLSVQQIEAGTALLQPYQHRMQPRQLSSGAWIIDDTYNGNIDGIEAGLLFLKELSAVKKIYVTPGLVDQGSEVESIHVKIGKLIADCNPDTVVLMNNSVTNFITQGLNQAGFKNELIIENDPLNYYTNIEQYLANGDVVLMQNDWPDNYK